MGGKHPFRAHESRATGANRRQHRSERAMPARRDHAPVQRHGARSDVPAEQQSRSFGGAAQPSRRGVDGPSPVRPPPDARCARWDARPMLVDGPRKIREGPLRRRPDPVQRLLAFVARERDRQAVRSALPAGVAVHFVGCPEELRPPWRKGPPTAIVVGFHGDWDGALEHALETLHRMAPRGPCCARRTHGARRPRSAECGASG
jgi:hypothetical protein